MCKEMWLRVRVQETAEVPHISLMGWSTLPECGPLVFLYACSVRAWRTPTPLSRWCKSRRSCLEGYMNEGSESGLGNAQLNELLQGIPEAGGAARGGGGYIHPLPVSQVLAIWDIKRWFPAMVWSVRYKVVQKTYEFELAESDSTKEGAPSGAKQNVGNHMFHNKSC